MKSVRELDTNNHSVFMLHYHLIMCTKYRREIIDNGISDQLKEIFIRISSRLIKKENPDIKKSLWKEMFWSQSFCLISTGGVSVDVIKQYIQTQGKKGK